MTLLEAIRESIAHWKRMRARPFKGYSRKDRYATFWEYAYNHLEAPSGKRCSLCLYAGDKIDDMEPQCSVCPLGQVDPCNQHGSTFQCARMSWETLCDDIDDRDHRCVRVSLDIWRRAADRMIEVLEALEAEEEARS